MREKINVFSKIKELTVSVKMSNNKFTGTTDFSGAVTMGTNKITGLGDPTVAQDAATKTYVDTEDAKNLPLAGGTMTGPILGSAGAVGAPSYAFTGDTNTGMWRSGTGVLNLSTNGIERMEIDSASIDLTVPLGMGSNKITGLGAPTTGTDAATKTYVDTAGLYLPLAGGTMTGDITHTATQDFIGDTGDIDTFTTGGGTRSATGLSTALQTTGATHSGIELHTATDAYSRISMITAGADVNYLLFDAYHDGSTLRSSDLGSNFAISKIGDQLIFSTDSAKSPGVASSFTSRLIMTTAGQMKFSDGTAGVPSMSFINDTDTGLYSPGANQLNVSIAGTRRLNFTTTRMINYYAASTTVPAYTFGTENTSGMNVNPGGNEDLGLIYRGVTRLSMISQWINVLTSTGLRLLSGSTAQKPSGTTWTNPSDERLKEEITLADLDQCISDFSSLTLKRFKWKDSAIKRGNINDVHQLGFIAQEVELTSLIGTIETSIHSVKQLDEKNEFITVDGVDLEEDMEIKTIDYTAIYACQIGCTKRLIQKAEDIYRKIEGTRTATIRDPVSTDTILNTDHIIMYDVDINTTVILPDNATFSGRKLIFIFIARTGSELITINRAGTDTIDDSTTTTHIMVSVHDKIQLMSAGNGVWYTI